VGGGVGFVGAEFVIVVIGAGIGVSRGNIHCEGVFKRSAARGE
jgi:hypothetical protein